MCGNFISSLTARFGVINWPQRFFTSASRNDVSAVMKNSALIIVDMQNDFLTGSLALSNCPSKHNGEEIIPSINKLTKLACWDIVVYTMDWHPADHVSFVNNTHLFAPHTDNKVDLKTAKLYDTVIFDVEGKSTKQTLWPAHCIPNTEGAELHKDLFITKENIKIKKGTNKNVDSYSAFFDNEHISKTELDLALKNRGISKVYICGVASDVCVNYTALDAYDLGYETYVIQDCCRGVSCDQIDAIFKAMEEKGISLTMSAEIFEREGHGSVSSFSS